MSALLIARGETHGLVTLSCPVCSARAVLGAPKNAIQARRLKRLAHAIQRAHECASSTTVPASPAAPPSPVAA